MVAPRSNPTFRYPRCIMGTCCVPWTAAYTLDEALFRLTVSHLAEEGTSQLYIFGTAGEGHAVSSRQFQQITRVFTDEMSGRGLQPMVGVISLSLSEVLDRIAWAGGLGVRRFQISLPSWGTCTPSEAFSFFEQVCARFPSFEFLHYNLKRAGRLLTAEEYGRISEAFPNLVAAKLAGSSGQEAAEIQAAAPSIRLFLTEKAFADAGALGVEAGLLISYASLNWKLARGFYQAVIDDDRAAVAEHRAEQQGVLQRLREAVGQGPHMDGAFDTLFLKKDLPGFPLRLLPPYQSASAEAYERFVSLLKTHHPAWMERD